MVFLCYCLDFTPLVILKFFLLFGGILVVYTEATENLLPSLEAAYDPFLHSAKLLLIDALTPMECTAASFAMCNDDCNHHD
jgi:hypothetical protein